MIRLLDRWAARRCARGKHKWGKWVNSVDAVQVDWARNYILTDLTVRRSCYECQHEDEPVFVRSHNPAETLLPVVKTGG